MGENNAHREPISWRLAASDAAHSAEAIQRSCKLTLEESGMRLALVGLGAGLAVLAVSGCSPPGSHGSSLANPAAASAAATPDAAATPSAATAPSAAASVAGGFLGFDRNDYPGDDTMTTLHRSFAFTGYWLTNPPGENRNSWQGKRALLRQQGWGFLVLADGRLDAEILRSQRAGISPAALARKDAGVAIAAARGEGFPAHTILFLDQEEGGQLLDEQAAYLLAWTQAVAASDYLPGVYASGQPSPNGPGQTITTVDDIRARVVSEHLHPVALFDAQDACPPAPGCTVKARPLSSSGELTLDPGGNLVAWQYSQSPRRPELTRSCAKTYGPDGKCYAPGAPTAFLDMDLADSPDPSHGR